MSPSSKDRGNVMTGFKKTCCLCGTNMAVGYARYKPFALCKSCNGEFTFDKHGNVIWRATQQIHKTYDALSK